MESVIFYWDAETGWSFATWRWTSALNRLVPTFLKPAEQDGEINHPPCVLWGEQNSYRFGVWEELHLKTYLKRSLGASSRYIWNQTQHKSWKKIHFTEMTLYTSPRCSYIMVSQRMSVQDNWLNKTWGKSRTEALAKIQKISQSKNTTASNEILPKTRQSGIS